MIQKQQKTSLSSLPDEGPRLTTARIILAFNIVVLILGFGWNTYNNFILGRKMPEAWHVVVLFQGVLLALLASAIITLIWIKKSLRWGMWFFTAAGTVGVVVMCLTAILIGGETRIPTIALYFHLGIFTLGMVLGFEAAVVYAGVATVILIGFGLLLHLNTMGSIGVMIAMAWVVTAPAWLVSALTQSLRRSEHQFRTIVRESLDGILVVRPTDGRILSANQAAQAILCYAEADLIQKELAALFPPGTAPVLAELVAALHIHNATRQVHEMLRADSSLCPVEWSATLIPWEKSEALLITLHDITQRRRAEAERERFTELLRAAADLTGRINAILDPRQLLDELLVQLPQRFMVDQVTLDLWDETTQTLLRRTAGEITPVPATAFAAPLSPRAEPGAVSRRAALQRAIVVVHGENPAETPASVTDTGRPSEVAIPLLTHGQLLGVLHIQDHRPQRFQPADLDVFTTLAGQIATALENARLFAALQQSVTRLQELSRRLVEVQENERRYIACELHDEIGQLLTGLKLLLDMAGHPPFTEDKRELLAEALGLTTDLIKRVRELSLDLRPSMLDNLGLLPTLQWYFGRYTTQTRIQVSFEQTGLERRFPPSVETTAYRIIQEGLTNVARHASVTAVSVRLWVTPDTLNVHIEDHGAGFDPQSALRAHNSSGLTGMQERAALLGGQCRVESRPGQGTRVVAQFPLAEGPETSLV